MRKIAKIDANQPQIVTALRAIGATVQSLANVGNGCPDIVVGWQGQNFLLEIKNPAQPPSGRKLTDDEAKWHAIWRGQKTVVETVDDALKAIGAIK